ncbi:serine-rich adhesin for platelets-like isoform X1 [Eleutherodactylus coqui]|uniref:serine-rich adhesin for platelets-like isoform X1 n=1 Tax=Eleutherodactylus coqui TaxID=57060 RepID=UPI00346316C5
MRAILSWTILLIFMAPCIFAGKCSVNITVEPQVIKAMIDTQENFCSATVTLMPVNILNKDNVTNDCDRWALVFEVEGLLEKLNFKFGSTNHKNKETLTNTYRSCIFGVEHEEWDVVNAYLQTVQKSPIEILQRVNYSLNKLDGFNPDYDSFSGCLSFYGKSRPTPKAFKGPQCVCPSPTTPTSSSATSQTSLSKSTTIYSSYTSPLAGDMSDYYPEKNSQGLDSSPSILTSMPSDLKPSTTTVDYLHSNTIEHSGDLPMHITEFTDRSREPSYPFISPNPSQTRTDHKQVNKDTSNSYTEGMYESVVSPTVVNPSVPISTHINEEFSTVPESDAIEETTKSEFGKQSSKGFVLQNSLSTRSMELDIETASNSVTKVHRSPVNMDTISRASVTTEGASSLSTSIIDPNLVSKSIPINIPSSGTGLSSTEDPEPVSQGKVIGDRNSALASSYLSSMYESVVSPTVENPSVPTSTRINREFSTVPESDAIEETTKSEFDKPSSKGFLLQNPLSTRGMELGIETASNSVTKVRRSPINMDTLSRASVTTEGASSLSPSISDPNLVSKSIPINIPSSGTGLSSTEDPEPVSQEKVIGDRNSALASFYLSSTTLTTKTELSMSSPAPGDQLSRSDASRNPVLNAHTSYSILPLQVGNIAIGDRQNSFSSPWYNSNPLPIVATDIPEVEYMKEKIYLQWVLIVTLVVFLLLFLCGFLYYSHQYRKLRRRLSVSCDVDLTRNPHAVLPEEREPFPVIECDTV